MIQYIRRKDFKKISYLYKVGEKEQTIRQTPDWKTLYRLTTDASGNQYIEITLFKTQGEQTISEHPIFRIKVETFYKVAFGTMAENANKVCKALF